MGLFDEPKSEKVGTALKEFEITSTPPEGYFWAGSKISFFNACKHFCAAGATGAGKSITLNLLMQSVLPRFAIDDGCRRRALVFDAKTDSVEFLTCLCPMDRIKILNPFDRRFVPWNIAADICTETDAVEFASLLFPKNEKETNPYFPDTARSLIAGVIKRFIATTKPGHYWTLRDVILAFHKVDTLQTVLNHPSTDHLQDHFRESNTVNFAGVKSTVDTALALYRPIAGFFASSPNKPISLKDWVNSEGDVLVFGNNEGAREATDTLNRLMFRQLSKFLIGRPGKIKNDETWIFLDELREMGALSGLRQLLLRGRSKGVAVAIGIQDVEGMYAVYGQHEGAEVIGSAQNVVILHINPTSPKTAEWASKVFSSRRDDVAQRSRTMSDNPSTSVNMKAELIPNVYPIEFMSLPMPGEGKELHYFGFTNELGFGKGSYGWEWLKAHGPIEAERPQTQPDFEPHAGSEWELTKLKPWGRDDEERLGLPNISSLKKDESQEKKAADGISELLK